MTQKDTIRTRPRAIGKPGYWRWLGYRLYRRHGYSRLAAAKIALDPRTKIKAEVS